MKIRTLLAAGALVLATVATAHADPEAGRLLHVADSTHAPRDIAEASCYVLNHLPPSKKGDFSLCSPNDQGMTIVEDKTVEWSTGVSVECQHWLKWVTQNFPGVKTFKVELRAGSPTTCSY
jgi:hypothetical protein